MGSHGFPFSPQCHLCRERIQPSAPTLFPLARSLTLLHSPPPSETIVQPTTQLHSQITSYSKHQRANLHYLSKLRIFMDHCNFVNIKKFLIHEYNSSFLNEDNSFLLKQVNIYIPCRQRQRPYKRSKAQPGVAPCRTMGPALRPWCGPSRVGAPAWMLWLSFRSPAPPIYQSNNQPLFPIFRVYFFF